MPTLEPSSKLVDFLVNTRFVKTLGRRLFPVFKAEARDGTTFYLRSRSGDWQVVKEVYEHPYQGFFEVTDEMTVIDGGAHIGGFTVRAAREVRKVIAFEPISENFEMLTRNVKANNLNNVTLVRAALGSREEDRPMNKYRSMAGNSFYERRDRRKIGTEIVHVTTLDSLDQKVDAIKINVEGHSLEVLKGGEGILEKYHPKIVISTDRVGATTESLADFLASHGYEWRRRKEILYAN